MVPAPPWLCAPVPSQPLHTWCPVCKNLETLRRNCRHEKCAGQRERGAVTPPCPCLSADFDRAEVGQPKAEGRERSPHSCHQQTLQIGSLSGMKRVPHASCQPATEPSAPSLCTANDSALGSIVTPALPCPLLYIPFLPSFPPQHTPLPFSYF